MDVLDGIKRKKTFKEKLKGYCHGDFSRKIIDNKKVAKSSIFLWILVLAGIAKHAENTQASEILTRNEAGENMSRSTKKTEYYPSYNTANRSDNKEQDNTISQPTILIAIIFTIIVIGGIIARVTQ